ncbi:MAG TPA: response regulator transcription factor [Verrucomicrobiae bacterium]|nr:response regulator transcription factor [Verrucomicrobiae bacterium]
MTSHSAVQKSSVYLIDDHPVIVQGISLLINSESDLSVVGSAATWPVAFKEIEELKPDVVVLDITLATANGVEVLKDLKIRFPEQRVLMLSMHDENLYATRAMKAGAYGYLMKASATEEVVIAIRQILKGEVYLSGPVSKRMMSQIIGRKPERDASPLDALSDRELEVYEMVGAGMTTRKIADRLHLSIKTIETHKAHLKEKLGLQSANELTQHAIQARP